MSGNVLMDMVEESELDKAIKIVKKTVNAASNDAGAPFSEGAINALRFIYDTDQQEYQRLRKILKDAGVGITVLEKLVLHNDDQSHDTNAADELVNLVNERLDLFHDESKKPYASFDVDGHRETYPIRSEGFSEWLAMTSYCETKRTPSENTINTALVAISGKAKFDGKQRKVFLRIADFDGGYVIDLADDKWRAVVISMKGWRIVNEPPVRFWRTATMRPLPMPVKGSYSSLWDYANISELDRDLVLAFIFECWRNNTAFPILELLGEQGTAKSTTQETIRAFIDPNEVMLRAVPKNTEDLFVSASANWLASYNNVSHISARMQDAFCTLATGGGFATRTLYTNFGESVVDVCRPTIINGITPLASAQDMIDRVIRVELPVIKAFRTDSEMHKSFELEKSSIFGGLLGLFVCTLCELTKFKNVAPRDRMADFVLLGQAVMVAMGKDQSFEDIYLANKTEAITLQLESSPVINALIEFMNENRHGYSGTVGTLLKRLEQWRPERGNSFPLSGNGLTSILKRKASALRKIGIGFKRDNTRHSDGYHISIFHISDDENKGTQGSQKDFPNESNEPCVPISEKQEKLVNKKQEESFEVVL